MHSGGWEGRRAVKIYRSPIGFVPLEWDPRNFVKTFGRGYRLWGLVHVIWHSGADIFPFQKHLYYPITPSQSSPRERRSPIFGVCSMRIDVLSFQKHLYCPLMPGPSRPREWCPAIFGVRLVRNDVRAFQKTLYCLSCPLLAAHVRAVFPVQSAALTAHSLISNTAVNISSIPKNAAPWSLVNPVSFFGLSKHRGKNAPQSQWYRS